MLRVRGKLFGVERGRFVSGLGRMRKLKKPKLWVIVTVMGMVDYGTSAKGRRALGDPLDYWVTPRLAAGTKPMGFPPWSRGPLLHRGEKRQLSPLVEHGDSNLVFDIT